MPKKDTFQIFWKHTFQSFLTFLFFFYKRNFAVLLVVVVVVWVCVCGHSFPPLADMHLIYLLR
jgi:fatty acid desaturase